jgi:hypothetical protein
VNGGEPYAAEHLRDVLRRPPIAELGIEVSILDDGRIRLEGPVSSNEQHAAVLDVMRSATAGATLVDDLTVEHRPPSTEPEVLG